MNRHSSIIGKLFRNSVISIIAAAIAAMLGIVIDGVIIGRFLGPDAMAAYGLVTPIVNLTTIFSGVFSAGTQVVCAQHLGAGRADRAKKAFSMCFLTTIIISALLMGTFLIFREPICVMLGARGSSAALLPLASDYLLGMLFSVPSVLMLFEFNALMRLDGDANRVIVAVAVMTVLDIAGDLLNVFVIHGGMLGMGFATSISYTIALIIMFFHFTKKNIIFKPSFKGLRLKDLGEILMTGSSSAVGSAATMLRNATLNQIMLATALSSTAIGALSVLNTVLNFTSSTMIGVGMTSAMIAGMILGEQDRRAAAELVRVTIKAALVVGGILFVILFLLASPIAGVFNGNGGGEMTEMAARALRIYSVSIVLYGINVSFINYTQGMRRMGISNIFNFLENFPLIVLPALLLFGWLDTDAVWVAFVVGEILTLLGIFGFAAVRKKGVPCHVEDFLFLKEPFGVPEEDRFEVSITKADQITKASENISEFCRSAGASEKQSMLLALFVEELSNNVIQYGFADGKDHSIDIRVFCQDKQWTLCFRDNCKLFDPTEWIKLHQGDDPTSNIGIRMVCKMAKDVRYLSTMQLNNLTIKI